MNKQHEQKTNDTLIGHVLNISLEKLQNITVRIEIKADKSVKNREHYTFINFR